MRNTAPRNKATDDTAAAHRARIYRGVQIRVAKELKLSRVHVSYVCRGLRRSRRVEAALAKAVREIERQHQQKVAA